MIVVVGMGPGHIKYVSAEALESVQEADIALAFGRIAETAERVRQPVIRVKRVDDLLAHIVPDRQVAVLASGDPCFYGIVEYLKQHNIRIDKIVPGISSFQYMMAQLQKSWQDAKFFSLHGRDQDLEELKNSALSVILTDSRNTPHAISKRLRQLNIQGRLYVGYNLSYENEWIVETRVGDDVEEHGPLAVVVLEHDLDT